MVSFCQESSGGISIHAPREGRDELSTQPIRVLVHISIHAPREGRDVFLEHYPEASLDVFQSTRPARGATQGH